jgi:hypothetical protein
MDPISTALVAALGKLGETAVIDAYNALKAALKKKFGKHSDLADALEGLEKKPESSGRRETLREEVVAAGANQDREIIKVANALIEILKAQPGGKKIIQQTVTGDQNIFSGTGDVKISSGQTK